VNDPYAFGRPAYWRAHIAALSGRASEAVTFLRDAMSLGYRPMDLNIITIHEEPDFMSLWGTAAFKELLRPRKGVAARP
jgi:hypothetical protein